MWLRSWLPAEERPSSFAHLDRRKAFGVLRVLSKKNRGNEYGRCAISPSNGLQEMLPGTDLACDLFRWK